MSIAVDLFTLRNILPPHGSDGFRSERSVALLQATAEPTGLQPALALSSCRVSNATCSLPALRRIDVPCPASGHR